MKTKVTLSSVSLIGLGGMARALDALAGKVIIDIPTPSPPMPPGWSLLMDLRRQEIARAVPASPHVVKASSSPLLSHNSNEGCTT